MRVSLKVFFVFLCYIFQSFNIVYAAVSFPFITSFNYDELEQPAALPDGLGWGGGWTFGDYKSQITSSANNPKGAGGRGFRFWVGDGQNINTGPIQVDFPEPQKELWIRWYMRYQEGFQWSTFVYDKNVYMFTGTQHTSAIAEFYGIGKYSIAAQNTPVSDPVKTAEGEGWNGIMGGTSSDGEFHCFEIHVKMDTNSLNGIGQIWLNGVLKASNLAVDWSGGASVAREGWIYFYFDSNQYLPSNGVAMYVDYDDMAVYNTTPPNQDALGNPYIGPLDAGPTYDPPTVTGPDDFSTTASSVEIEGPYAVDPDLADQSVVVTWTLGEDSGFAVAALGVFSCTVPVELGSNSIVFQVVDSNAGEDLDTTVVTRTLPFTLKTHGSVTFKSTTLH